VAQKSFSKLRSAIAGLYAWRLGPDCPLELRPKDSTEQNRLLKEADFALRQAYAYCPYSPEAVHKLMSLLVGSGRLDEAILITQTSLKFDPTNALFQDLVTRLRAMRDSQGQPGPVPPAAELPQFSELESRFRSNPQNLQVALELAGAYRQMQRTDQANQVLDYIVANPQADVASLLAVAQSYAEMGSRLKLESVLQRLKSMAVPLQQQYQANTNDIALAFQLVSVYMVSQQSNAALQLLDELTARPNADPNILLSAAQAYAQMGNPQKLEVTLRKMVTALPDNPEAWYDLAAIQATLGKGPDALQSLRTALELNQKRLATQPAAKDLRQVAAAEQRFAPFRQLPEFQRLMRTN
jgi:thioredoxin-like negative regulator of GroEL